MKNPLVNIRLNTGEIKPYNFATISNAELKYLRNNIYGARDLQTMETNAEFANDTVKEGLKQRNMFLRTGKSEITIEPKDPDNYKSVLVDPETVNMEKLAMAADILGASSFNVKTIGGTEYITGDTTDEFINKIRKNIVTITVR